MKVLIAGAGGIGGYYGAKLSRAGHDVFFIARGAHLTAISKNGLNIKSINGDFTVRAPCGETAESFGVADLVIVCVKAYDTIATLDLYKSVVGPDTVILSLQNGIENEKIIAQRYGVDKVMGGVAFIGSRVLEPGIILHTAFGHITIGRMDGHISDQVEKLGAIFNKAGIKCKLSGDIQRELWSKMVWNIGFNALCAIADRSAKDVAASKNTRPIALGAMTEWINVARASGMDLPDEIADRNIEVTLKGGEVIPSMLHDKRRGRRMEIDTFNGKAVELGEQTGTPTPINATLTGIVRLWNKNFG